MKLILAPEGESRLPIEDRKLNAHIVHVDADNNVLWLCVPDMPEPPPVDTFWFVWSHDIQTPRHGGQSWTSKKLGGAVDFTSSVHRFLIRHVVPAPQLAANMQSVPRSSVVPALFPSGFSGSLADFLVEAGRSDFEAYARAVAEFAALSEPIADPLSLWLSKTPGARAQPSELHTLPGFSRAIANRPALFDQLSNLIDDRCVVFLLGGENSFLRESFVPGFQSFLHGDPKHCDVSVDFDYRAFDQVLTCMQGAATHLPIVGLHSLFATLTFCALRALRQQSPKRNPISTLSQVVESDQVELFLRVYNLNVGGVAGDRETCILAFLDNLGSSVEELGFKGKIVVFLPFNELEVVLSSREGSQLKQDAATHLFEALRRLALAIRKRKRPKVRLVFAARHLPLNAQTDDFIRRYVLPVPRLTNDELQGLVRTFFKNRSPAEPDVSVLAEWTGGMPWCAYLVFRCAHSLPTASTGENADPNALIVGACQTAARVLDDAFLLCQQEERADGSTRTAEIALAHNYLDTIRRIFEKVPAILGASDMFQGPGFAGVQRRFTDTEEAWIETGLLDIRPCSGRDAHTLDSLRDYPAYELAFTGTLPRKLANAAKRLAEGA